MTTLRNVLRRLLRGGPPPAEPGIWIAAIALLVAVIAAVYPVTRLLDRAVVGSSSGIYLELAANNAWCGRYPYLTALDPANVKVIDLTNVVVGDVPNVGIRQLAIERTGSLDRYCAMTGGSFVMNEMSFAALESVLLRIDPGITFAGLAENLSWLRVGLIVLFGLSLIRVGHSLLFVGAVTLSALYLNVLIGGNALFSQYPFFVPIMMGGVGAVAVSLSYGWHRRNWSSLAVSGLLGVWTLFVGNLRTSLYPEALLVSVLFLWFAWRDRCEQPSKGLRGRRWLAVAGAAWLLGALAFDTVYIRPVRNLPSVSNSSAHGIAHPLVLGLAVPPNALAQREGISWNDDVGRILAQRVDPTVHFLGERYERTLFTYYRRLWADYPAEMMSIYVQKFRGTTASMLAFLRSGEPQIFWSEKDGYWLSLLVWPAAMASKVLPIPLLFVALLASGWVRWRSREPGQVFLWSAIGLVGLITFAEAAIILGGVILWYSSVLLCCTVFVSALGYQWLMDLLWRATATVLDAASPRVAAHARSIAIVLRRASAAAWRELAVQRTTPSLTHAAAHTLVGAALVVVAVPHWFEIERTPTTDQDAIARLGAAITRVYCGTSTATTAANEVVTRGVADADAMIQPITALIETHANGVEALCATTPAPRAYSASTMGVIETLVLRRRPAISFAGVAKLLHYSRAAIVFGFAATLAVAGAGVLLTTTAAFGGLWVLVLMKNQIFSVSPFGMVLLLQSMGFVAILWRSQWLLTRRAIGLGATAAWLAIVAALSSWYLPLHLVLFTGVFLLGQPVMGRDVRH